MTTPREQPVHELLQQVLADADLTMRCYRWLPPGRELVLYDQCPVCRHPDWMAGCRKYGACQLRGVGAGINAAIRDSLLQLITWPTPYFDFTGPTPVFKN